MRLHMTHLRASTPVDRARKLALITKFQHFCRRERGIGSNDEAFMQRYQGFNSGALYLLPTLACRFASILVYKPSHDRSLFERSLVGRFKKPWEVVSLEKARL